MEFGFLLGYRLRLKKGKKQNLDFMRFSGYPMAQILYLNGSDPVPLWLKIWLTIEPLSVSL